VRITLLSAFLVGASAFAVPASAQNVDSKTLIVQSTIPSYCSELGMQDETLDLGNLTGTTGQLVTEFAQNDTLTLETGFYCNAPSTVKIVAEPLRHDTVTTVADFTSFTNRVDYTASLKWNDQDLPVVSTDSDGAEFNITQANIGDMELKISDPTVADNLRPIAGGYAGLVRLTISLAQ